MLVFVVCFCISCLFRVRVCVTSIHYVNIVYTHFHKAILTVEMAILIGIEFHQFSIKPYRRSPKFLDTQYVCCNHPKIQTKRSLRNLFKRCRWNGKQCRPRSDCSSRSSLIWLCTVCQSLWHYYLCNEPHCELTCQCFRPGLTQLGLYSHR